MKRRAWLWWIAGTLAVAVMVYAVTLRAVPRLIEARVLPRLGAPNSMHFSKPPTAATRLVVRPSPNLLYAACPFDLTKGALRITARVPHSTYWSVSGFDADTNNFFVRDNRQIAGNAIEIIVLRPGMSAPPTDGLPDRIVLDAPTDRGLFLLRVLIDPTQPLAKAIAIQHQASCATLAPSYARG